MEQYNLNFKNETSFTQDNFLVSECNKSAFDHLIKNDENNVRNFFLYGEKKSGKSHLASIWLLKNNSIKLNINECENDELIKINNNILIDNIFQNINEEKIFYLINHCISKNLKILFTSDIKPINYNFLLQDLSSRIKSFHLIQIYKPDDYLISNLIIKLLNDKQIKIKNNDVINFLSLRIDRSFDNLYSIINKIDRYSLSTKREITIPLIKEII